MPILANKFLVKTKRTYNYSFYNCKPNPLQLTLQEALICGQGLNDQDIQMLLALSEAMTCADGLVPPEAVRLFKKAMKQRRGSVDNVAETLMSSLTGYSF